MRKNSSLSDVVVQPAYADKLTIDADKAKDLLKLCQFIPPDCQAVYTVLQPTSTNSGSSSATTTSASPTNVERVDDLLQVLVATCQRLRVSLVHKNQYAQNVRLYLLQVHHQPMYVLREWRQTRQSPVLVVEEGTSYPLQLL